jgi:hypothetical protein
MDYVAFDERKDKSHLGQDLRDTADETFFELVVHNAFE